MAQPLPEVWLRGPVEGIPSLLQPIAHALLQAVEEMEALLKDFPNELLWERPAGMASPAFHLLHIAGVLDRLCTYARAEPLSEEQLSYLKNEGSFQPTTAQVLLTGVKTAVDNTLDQLKQTPENLLTGFRAVGRKGLPSTVHGLLFHAAEHTMRHLGQLLVTVRILNNKELKDPDFAS